jgi:hypothetical protein
MNTLKRRANSGFVQYPKTFEKRIIDGTARYRTKCDMLVGPCSCGGVHQEHDDWVRRLLTVNDSEIEQLTLAPEDDGTVHIPRYWLRPRGHERCTVFSGSCACGRTHTANENWIQVLLANHGAKIVGCPEADGPIIEDVITHLENDAPGGIPGCTCEDCEHERRRNNYGRRLNRNQI